MEFITFVKKENVNKAEEAVKGDFDLAAKQSIKIRDAGSLGLKGEGSYFYITGSDEGTGSLKTASRLSPSSVSSEIKRSAI